MTKRVDAGHETDHQKDTSQTVAIMTDSSSPSTTGTTPPTPTVPLLAVAGVGVVVCVVGAMLQGKAFWAGYLVAAWYWLGVSLGCLGIGLIHRTTEGRWGHAIGRELHSGIAALVVSLIACGLLVAGAEAIYPWASAESSASQLNDHQKQYLEPMLVLGRFVLFSLLWLGHSFWMLRRYRSQAKDVHNVPAPKMAAISLALFFIAASFTGIDLVMSLSPGWMSSLFPLLLMMNFSTSGMALCIIIRCRRLEHPTEDQLALTHDLSNLLQAFNLLWAYLAFSQYLIIWSGDLPYEVDWYLERRTAIGVWASMALFLFRFLFPFVLLLSRDLKRSPTRVRWVAALLLVMCLVDIGWVILPSIDASSVGMIVFTVASWLAIGAIWLLMFFRSYSRLPKGRFEDAASDVENLPHGAHA